VAAETAVAAPPPKAESKQGGAETAAKNGEAYWRAEAGKIRVQIEAVDAQIAGVKETIAKMGSADVRYAAQQDVFYIKDREAELKALEARKAALESEFALLEERGRKAGAQPGWFR
jgi:hypothetical protein